MVSRELVAASSAPIVLSILSRGESYGYAIIQQVKEMSGGQLQWTDGMLYPVLHRLERDGVIQSVWRVAGSGRKRKYYKIQTKGKRVLEEQKEQWTLVHNILGQAKEMQTCLT